MLVLRLLHVLAGVFWAGTLMFTALLLGPAVGDAGPEGGKVMAALQKRRFMDIMPAVALVTIVSGIWLFWRVSNGLDPAYFKAPAGHALATGGVLALIAFIVGVGMVRPGMMQVGARSQALAQMPAGPERDQQQAALQQLRRRSMNAGRVVAVLLALATVLMAVARYL